ncbi:MAG: hypothetical protein R3F61_25610 [Myxococcota bacterium]
MTTLLFLLACSGPTDPSAGPEPEATVDAQDLPPIEHALRTTNGLKAMEGLDLRVQSLLANLGGLQSGRAMLLDTLSLRVSLQGRMSDIDRMFELAGDDPELQAKALMMVHRFDEALALDPSVADSVALARQQGLDALEAKRRAEVEANPSTITWERLADVLGAQGRTVDADRAYAEALAAYRDVSPLTVADIQFRRGMLWGEAGTDPERARALYTDAVERLPGFVRAQVHLAELEHDAGDVGSAIERVRRVASAEDPEPGGKLALWLEGEEAETWKARTIATYDALLAKHRLAFADHAAEFYLGLEDLDHARPLAADNLANRPTGRATELCERAGCE